MEGMGVIQCGGNDPPAVLGRTSKYRLEGLVWTLAWNDPAKRHVANNAPRKS